MANLAARRIGPVIQGSSRRISALGSTNHGGGAATRLDLCRQQLCQQNWQACRTSSSTTALQSQGKNSHLKEVLEAAKEDPEELDPIKEAAAKAGKMQGVLWFANVFPTKAFRFDFRQIFTHHNHEKTIQKLMPAGVEITQMIPREREGGVFVYFRAPPIFVLQVLRELASANSKPDLAKMRFMPKGISNDEILKKVCAGISQYLKKHEVRAFLCPFPVRAHRVEGVPFVEDLHQRYPNSQLEIKLDPPNPHVCEETVYARLRRYGQLDDLKVLPDGKGFKASFRYTAAAVAARNCLHRATVNSEQGGSAASSSSAPKESKFHMEFNPFMQKWIWEFLSSNARFVIPFAAALVFATSYFIWDPLRTLCVYLKIASTQIKYSSSSDESHSEGPADALFRRLSKWQIDSPLWRWRGKRVGDLFDDFWAGRDSEIAEAHEWLDRSQDQVLLLTGHRGNGLNQFSKKLIGEGAVFVDVAEILEAGGATDDQIFLQGLCKSVGYWPVPGMDHQLSALIELMVPGSGKLSRENEVLTAVQRILSALTKALIALKARRQKRSKSQKSEVPPIFVISGFTAENKDRRIGFFQCLVSWAAYVSEAELARVVFVADSSFGEPAILAGLQDRPERLSVHQTQNCDRNQVRRMLENHVSKEYAQALSEEELESVGGRFRDISALVSHMQHNVNPSEAVQWLVEGSEVTVRRLLMLGQEGVQWTRPQLWRAIRLLSSAKAGEGVPYDVFLWSVFRGDEAALRSMKESGLIFLEVRKNFRLDENKSATGLNAQLRYKVVAGSPLFAQVYRRLVSNEGLAAMLDLEVAKEDIKREQTALVAFEEELARLEGIVDAREHREWLGWWKAREADAVEARIEQLSTLIAEQHKKLEKYHAARRNAMAVLSKCHDNFTAANQEQTRKKFAKTDLALDSQRGFLSQLLLT
eukprot:TRINITY_DN14707_c0_g1_i1.p1 TRINITY_DN14707_c0_g1~~TRINITY_DN14707_c0_g1_i1.p1  ORF type:complete len:954 (+),score=178.10 TRINITY_DN14707_c0_g1_i1:78-2864(+)